jgi:hypothetical protein
VTGPSGPDGGGDGILGGAVGDDRLAWAAALGVPAFVRRARALEDAVERLRASIARERARRLRPLLAPARRLEESRRLGAVLPPAVAAVLDILREEPGFAARAPSPARSPARAAADLLSRAREFNRRWPGYLESVPIGDVRALQSDYNRYYPIEREMALRGVKMAFREVPLLEAADLARWFPPLPEPGGEAHAR